MSPSCVCLPSSDTRAKSPRPTRSTRPLPMIWTMTGPAGDEGRERREEHGTAVLENETVVSAVKATAKAMANGDDDDDGYEEREGGRVDWRDGG